MYITFVINLLKGKSPELAYKDMNETFLRYYSSGIFQSELRHFSRILNGIWKLDESQVRSGGYVVDTLEASLWCFMRNKSFRATLIEAVNLGEDTDTVGAVTGGIAGIQYGFDSIPEDWRDKIIKKDEIISLADRLQDAL